MLRWLARAVGLAAIVGGVVLVLLPFDTDVTIRVEPLFRGTSECESPVREAFGQEVDGASLVDEPGARPELTTGFGCEQPARQRLALGGSLVLFGVAVSVLSWAWRRRPLDATMPESTEIPEPAAPAPAAEPTAAGDADEAAAVVGHYESTHEEDRLASGLGQLELVRTRQILRAHLPPAPATIIDVGGGTGVHAAWLAEAGYQVHVVDLTPRHVQRVTDRLGGRGVTAAVGDARHLDAADASFDAALLLGPLYHLSERADRVAALREVGRVVRPGGVVAVAAINRFASLFDGLVRGFLFDPDFREIVGRDLRDGRHRNDGGPAAWFTTAYFHHPDELRAELVDADLGLEELVGVEGLAGWLPHLEAQWATPEDRQVIVEAAQGIQSEPALLGLSAHLLAVARRPGGKRARRSSRSRRRR